MALSAERRLVLTFLLRSRDSRVARRLRKFGFDQAVHAEGRRLLDQAIALDLDGAPPSSAAQHVAALAAWKKEFFGVIDAVLTANDRAARDVVFAGLEGPGAPPVVECVEVLLARLDAQPVAVRTILQARRIGPEVLEEARAHLRALQETPVEDPARRAAAVSVAEAALADWYVEWSGIARSAIGEPRLLRMLGLSTKSSEGAFGSESGASEVENMRLLSIEWVRGGVD